MANTDGKQATAVAEYLDKLGERQKTSGLADFAGLDIALAIPITQTVLDDLLRPVPFPEPVCAFRLRFTGDDLITLEVGLNVFLFKTTVRVEARVERYVPFPRDPVLTLTLLTGGIVEMGLNVIPFPDWIKVEGRQVQLNLGKLLRDSGQEWLVSILRDVKFNVRPGVLNLTGRLVGPGAATVPIPTPETATTDTRK